MASNKRTWLWIIAGVFGALFLFVLAVVGFAVFEFKTHVTNEIVETAIAERQFDEQRAKFAGQQPLIEFVGRDDRDGDDRTSVHRPPAGAPRVEVHALRVLVYNRQQNHLVHVDVPGWVLRLMPNGRYSGFDGDEEFTRHRITIEDIERHGYGLVLDGHNRNTRILVWSE